MLGQDVLARLAGESGTAVAANRAALDITDPAAGARRPRGRTAPPSW